MGGCVVNQQGLIQSAARPAASPAAQTERSASAEPSEMNQLLALMMGSVLINGVIMLTGVWILQGSARPSRITADMTGEGFAADTEAGSCCREERHIEHVNTSALLVWPSVASAVFYITLPCVWTVEVHCDSEAETDVCRRLFC